MAKSTAQSRTSRRLQFIPFSNPLSEVGLPTEDADLFGLVADDLQSDIAIDGDTITGTSKYVTGYTGFSESVELQSGNFLALHIKGVNVDSIKAGVDPTEGSGLVTIPNNEDDIVVRLSDTQEQKFVVEYTVDGETTRTEYTLDLTREES